MREWELMFNLLEQLRGRGRGRWRRLRRHLCIMSSLVVDDGIHQEIVRNCQKLSGCRMSIVHKTSLESYEKR